MASSHRGRHAGHTGALLRCRKRQRRRRRQNDRRTARGLFEQRRRAGRSAYRDQNPKPTARGMGHFRHVDNVPPVGPTEPDAKQAGAPHPYFNASKPNRLWPKFGSPGTPPVSLARPPKINPEPMQVVRRQPILLSTMAMIRYCWSLPGIEGTSGRII
jgi:hypothetical protein